LPEESNVNAEHQPTIAEAVRFSGASKKFGRTVALDDLHLTVPCGALYGLVGPNGSGKTTAIRGLLGLLRFDSGEAWLLGEKAPVARGAKRVNFMPQDLAIYEELTIRENLDLFSELNGMKLPDAEADRLLDMVDLKGAQHRMASDLSGGMKRRTSLVCALAGDPELIFLDEPTVGVDPELREGFWKAFRRLASEGKTVVLTTHYLDEAMHCDRIGMMRFGKLIAEGTPEEILQRSGCRDLEDAFLHFCRRQQP
jgi:ABC-2 type transport system ATP-binding protein